MQRTQDSYRGLILLRMADAIDLTRQMFSLLYRSCIMTDFGLKQVYYMERSIRKWVLWISFYNIKVKSIYGTFYTKMGLVDFIL